MIRTSVAFGFFACVLAASLASGYGLYVLNRARAVEQFQDGQLHTAHAVAATLRSELGGLSRTLRAMADADDRTRRGLFEAQCPETPCFAAAAAYDDAGRVRYSSRRPLGIGEQEIARALPWAADPRHRSSIRTVISSSQPPSLLLLTPAHDMQGPLRGRSAIVAGEVEFDSIFSRQRAVDDKWPNYTTLVLGDDGSVLFHSRHPEMRLNNVRQRKPECFECHDTFWYVERMLQAKAGIVQYSLHGVPHLGAFAPLEFEGQSWIAAVMGPAENAVGVVSAQGRELGLLMIATIVALGAAGHVTWRDGRRRLQAEADAVRKEHLERSHGELTVMNAKLESAALEWRTTVDTIDAALVVLEPSGCIERMNRAASKLLPGEPFTWLGQPSERLSAHPPWDAALPLARDAIEQDAILTSRVNSEATGRTWDLWCRPSQRTHGRTDSVVIVARDVTALVELQESLRRSETMAALGSLVAGVAHEVRNPLFAISSLVDAWSVQKQADARPFHQALRGEVARLKSLMNDLLEYGTPAKSVPRRYSLRSIIQEAVRSCEHEAEARRVRIVTSPRAADAEVSIDPQRFVRVLINVIQNAVQHAPAGSDVTVGASVSPGKSPSSLQITVRDRGPGFRDEDLPRVFTPFFSRRAGGFGLGLAISERIVAEHRGRMAAANHPDGGGVVSVVLPLTQSEPAAVYEGAQLC